MLGLRNLFKHNDKAADQAKKSGEEKGEVSHISSAGSAEMTLLVNETDKTLVLRDKVAAAYGATRYKIPGKSEMKVNVTQLQHTFYKMIPYALDEEGEEEGEEVGEHSSHKAHHQDSHHKKKKSIDTKLTIDSDRLAECEKIVIYQDELKYKVQYFPR